MFWTKTLSAVVAFAVTLVVVRVIGKKALSQMTYWDLVSAIVLGALSADVVISTQTPRWLGIWVLLFWGSLTIAVGWLSLRSRPFRMAALGQPTLLVYRGKVLEEAMRKERLSLDGLMAQLRPKGYFHISEVELAVLEVDGKLSVTPTADKRPVTTGDLKVTPAKAAFTRPVISDGKIMYTNLEQYGHNRDWLMGELSRQGITDPAEVFAAEILPDGSLWVDRKQDGFQKGDLPPVH